MGVVTISAAYGAGGAEVAPAVARAAGAALPRPGHPRAGRRPAGGAGRGGRGQRRDRRPRAVAPGRLAGHHARPGRRRAADVRRCPTRAPTASRPSGCWPRSPPAPGAWCSAGPRRWCSATGPTRCTCASTARGSGGWRRRWRGPGRPRDEVRREMEANDRRPRGLRAALLPVRPGRGRGTTTWWSTAPRSRVDVGGRPGGHRRPGPRGIGAALSDVEPERDHRGRARRWRRSAGHAAVRRPDAPGSRRREEPRRSSTSGVSTLALSSRSGEEDGVLLSRGRPCRRGCTRCTR